MPNISDYLRLRFGIAVYMYYGDVSQHPAPHVHVEHRGQDAVIRLPDGEKLEGDFPARSLRKVRLWIALNEEALMERWALAVRRSPSRKSTSQSYTMPRTPKITAVEPRTDYTLLLSFENGERRVYDMKPELETTVFHALRDPELFREVQVVRGSLEWPGERDLAYDMLHYQSEPAEASV